MPAGVGTFLIPLPVVGGADAPQGTYSIPMFSVAGTGGAVSPNYILPKIVATGRGTVPVNTCIFNVPVITASGVGYASVIGTGSFTLPLLVTSNVPHINSSGTITLPMVAVRGVDTAGRFLIPSITFGGYGTLIPITKIYRGVAMNIATQAISTYSNFNFNSLGYFDGKYFGANDDGIYLLGGDRDANGLRINSKLKTGSLDFGEGAIKWLSNVWLTYRSPGHLALVVYVDESDSGTAELQTQIASNELHEERIKTPRGARGRFYTLELKNLSGADFDLNSVHALAEVIRRKVR